MDENATLTPEEEVREELNSLARSFAAMKRLIEENNQLGLQRDRFERAAALAENENGMLRKQNRQLTGQRDHYFRAFTALAASLDTVGSGLVTAVQHARTHAHGDQSAPPPEYRKAQQRGEDETAPPTQPQTRDFHHPIPAFLNTPIEDEPSQSPINLRSLERAISGRP